MILIEALPCFERYLKGITEQYRGEYHLVGLGDVPQRKIVSVHDSNKAKAGVNVLDQYGDSKGTKFEVEITTLDGLLGGREFAGGCLLKTDIQGADLRVIAAGVEVVSQMDVVIVEGSLFHNDNLVIDIMMQMNQLGFELHDIVDGKYRPYDNALGQVDLFFVKGSSTMRRNRSWSR
jgi:FkbM family methyltransferase